MSGTLIHFNAFRKGIFCVLFSRQCPENNAGGSTFWPSLENLTLLFFSLLPILFNVCCLTTFSTKETFVKSWQKVLWETLEIFQFQRNVPLFSFHRVKNIFFALIKKINWLAIHRVPQSVILTLNVAYGVPQTYSKNSNIR